MDSTAFIRGLFGNAQRAALELPTPLPATHVMVTAAEIATPGWMQRVIERNGECGALQIITATGEAVAFVEDAASALMVARAQEVVPPEVIEDTAQGSLFA